MEAKLLPTFDDLMTTMVDSEGNRMGVGREPGLHLSDITKWLRKKRPGQKMGGIDGEQEGLRMFMGFVWEFALELAFKALMRWRGGLAKQPKSELDGIHVSPDGLDTDEWVLEEYKLTWRSMGELEGKKAPGVKGRVPLPLNICLEENFWEWSQIQIPGYLKVLSERLGQPIRKCRLYIAFMNGDYSFQRARGPQIVTVEMEYSDADVESAWQMILSAKRGWEQELALLALKEVA